MYADLHLHSKYSDGTLWPADLVMLAKDKGLEMIALTDHDSFEGVPEFLAATSEAGISGIPAVEIDFTDKTFGFTTEILGYFPAGNFQNTHSYLSHFRRLRRELALCSIEKAKAEYNILDLSLDELLDNKLGNEYAASVKEKISITKPDILSYLNFRNIPHGFSGYLAFKQGFYRDRSFTPFSEKPDFVKCLEMITADGGYAVLAHPGYQFEKDTTKLLSVKKSYSAKLDEAKKTGLWGIELHAYENEYEAESLNTIFLQIANECGLEVTYGSDFHGANIHNPQGPGCLKSDFKGFIQR